MTLIPCVGCRRHVALDAMTCPFCGAAVPRDVVAPPPMRVAGRLSRAAVFAGATLAGCYTSAPDPQSPPPPPDDHRRGQEVVVQSPPPPPVDAGPFAQPPPDASTRQQQLASGELRGRVTVGPNGRPHVRGEVRLFAKGQPPRTTYTDANGEYVFQGLPEGLYEVIVEQPRPNHPRHSPPPAILRRAHVAAGGSTRVDVAVDPPSVIDHGPCCKPYGAPPARRRVV